LRRQHGQEKAWAIPFWVIGNENWGCGDHMTPEYYADLYCQYHNFMKNYGNTPMMRITSGYGGSDTDGENLAIFMDRIMNRRFPVKTDGVSIHYYVYLRNDERHSATQFGDSEWFTVLKLAHDIGGVIDKNAAVLDQYDPDKRLWLIVDEWGTWYRAEPDTNPEFLVQQNSIRDALVAALTLHIFHEYNDRVQMANIAQAVNVLQAMLLTEGNQMILTPSYHMFEMFKRHQDATRLGLECKCELIGMGDMLVPAISASASRAANGDILLTLCNLDPHQALTVTCASPAQDVTEVSGVVLAGDAITAHNTFATPNRVQPVDFKGVRLDHARQLTIELPAASVVAVTLR